MFAVLFGMMYSIVYYGSILLLIAILLLYFNQNKMLYVPNMPSPEMRFPESNPEKFRSPSEYDMTYEDVRIITKDNLRLHGWFIKQVDPQKVETLIFFQANAGNIGFRLPNIHKLYEK